MCLEKSGGVEMYDASEYLGDRGLWGDGGLLLHEYCHAYHSHCLKDGYANADIQEVRERAVLWW